MSETTTTTSPSTVNLALLELLLNGSAAGKLPVVLLQVGQAGSSTAADLSGLALSHQARALLNSALATSNSGRSKRTAGRVCVQCGTSATVQWRKGPDGSTSLCNACGQRYHRQKAAEERQKSQRQHCQQKHRNLIPAAPHITTRPHVNSSSPSVAGAPNNAKLHQPLKMVQRRPMAAMPRPNCLDTATFISRPYPYENFSPVSDAEVDPQLLSASSSSTHDDVLLYSTTHSTAQPKRSTIYSLLN